MREPTPELVNTPSPSGKYVNFAAYIDYCVSLVGTNANLGKLLGFTSGTRVADWRKARGGRPSVESCLLLADLTGDDPYDVLVMGGWSSVAALLKKLFGERSTLSVATQLMPRQKLRAAREALEYAEQLLSEGNS